MNPSYPLQLNLGSGRSFREDYLNVDIRDYWAPDLTVDLNLPFPDRQIFHTRRFGTIQIAPNTFRKVIAHDVLEHIQNLPVVMKSCLDLLEVGGEFEIIVPYDLSYGAWQDPTHAHAFNEKSWLYYTDWFWYLGWNQARFQLVELHFEMSAWGAELLEKGLKQEDLLRTPRAVDAMHVRLQKVLLSDQDQQTLRYYTRRSLTKPKFAVCIVSPPNYPHSEAFREIAETIHYALLELGYDSMLSSRLDFPDRRHIILGANLLATTFQLRPDSILYNLEQVYLDSPWFQPAMLELYKQYPIWDASLKNIEQFTRLGITQVQHVPVGYVPQLFRIPQTQKEDLDVLFYGSLNQRRRHIIETLKAHGVNAVAIFGRYGSERDHFISRAKIILNLHFYPTKIFEMVRVSYLLANRRFVISEGSADSPEEQELAGGLVFAEYDDLIATCLDYLARPDDRKRIAEQGFRLMVQRPAKDYLRNILTH